MKKTILFLLIMSTIFCASCARGQKENDLNLESDAAQSETFPSDPVEYINYLSDKSSFDGETYTIIGRNDGVNFPSVHDTMGTSLDRSIRRRDLEVKEKFGVKTEYVRTADDKETCSLVKNSVAGGDSEYDLIIGSIAETAAPLTTQGLLYPANKLENINLSGEWWAPSLEDSFLIKDKLFILSGAIVPEYYNNASCVIFNKNIAREFNVSNLYEIVRRGAWTVDKMFESAAVIPDGSGLFRYGVGREDAGIAFLTGASYGITRFDENRSPFIEKAPHESVTELAKKVSSVLCDKSISMVGNFDGSISAEDARHMFMNSRILFLFDETGTAAELRGKDSEFGILPYPKLNENQSEYISYADSWGGIGAYIPKNIKDESKTGLITEALCAASKKHLDGERKDSILAGRQTYDSDSKETVDIILRGMKYDLLPLYSDGGADGLGNLAKVLSSSFFKNDPTDKVGFGTYAGVAAINIERLLKASE